MLSLQALKALLDVQQRDLHLLQTICSNAWSSSSGQSGKHKQLKKQHSIVFIGWDGDSAVNADGVNGSGKMVDKSVRKSLEDAFKTAKTLHKHFKVCIYIYIVCIYSILTEHYSDIIQT